MSSPIYPQGQQNTPGPQPMMREISHDGQVGGGVYSQGQGLHAQGSPVGQQQQQHQNAGQPQQQQQQQHQQQPAAPPAPPPMNLASVLHYLQSEWRRWERDRNEWEIERAEMRARIALLEGERRSAENLKMDMLRRVKMLEFALKQERAKSLAGAGRTAGMGGGLGGLAGKTVGETGEKKDVGGDSPKNGSENNLDQKKTNGSSPNNTEHQAKKPQPLTTSASRAGSIDSNPALPSAVSSNPWKSTVSMPVRDPKSRVRSRDYLKQCLQEISYLTSPAAMNPLPNRLPLTLTVPPTNGVSPSTSTTGDAQPTSSALAAGTILDVPERPRKVLSEGPFPSSQPDVIGLGVKGAGELASPPLPMEPQEAASGLSNLVQEVAAQEGAEKEPTTTAAETEKPSGASGSSESGKEAKIEQEQAKVLTAIYKPESKEAWKQALKEANEQAEKTGAGQARAEASDSSVSDGGDSDSASVASADTDVTAIHEDDVPIKKGWKPTRQLKSHLDAVQAVAFGPEATIVSGSWDCTVKVWRLASEKSGNRLSDGLEPQITFRGHLAPVTSLAVSSSRRKIFSGSLDSSIRVWNLPSVEHHTYTPHDPKLEDDTLVGHTDAVWALALLPSAADEPEGYLVSASSDSSVKVWSTTGEDGSGYPLVSGWKYDGTADHVVDQGGESETSAPDQQQEHRPVPVALAMYHPDLSLVLVGYDNGIIKLFEIKTGREVRQFEVGESGAALVDVICHPTLSKVVAAMNDGTIRIFDAESGKMEDTVQAHSSTINALRVDPTSSSDIITAGDDLSIKVWNLESSTNTHEWTAHRKKGEQGVLALDVCDDAAVIAAGGGKDGRGRMAALVSGGADGAVRLYSKA